jgi:S1-C subfamily serine protease
VQSLGPNHFGFSKAELSHALQDPKQAGALGRATPGPGGGLVLDEVPAGGLSEHIGLRAGDILRQANGQTLNSLTDLPRLYQEFGTATSVRLEIVRGGQAMILQYTVRP